MEGSYAETYAEENGYSFNGRPVNYDTLKEVKVKDYKTDGTKELYVKSITAKDAETFSSYEITVTLSSKGMDITVRREFRIKSGSAVRSFPLHSAEHLSVQQHSGIVRVPCPGSLSHFILITV
ncbi:MAG: hypothetical protein ACI4WS_12470 [Oscillospiraceae bacterium]